MWLPEKERPKPPGPRAMPVFAAFPVPRPDPEPLRCSVSEGVNIPGCWSALLYGDDACDCPGTPHAIANDRRWRALQRLQRMREKRRIVELAADGVASLPGAKPLHPMDQPAAAPIRLRNLRLVARSQ